MTISNPEFSNSSLLKPVDIHGPDHHTKKSLPAVMLAAIGVVFGDIGTSPLYALKECFDAKHGIPFSVEALYGVISMPEVPCILHSDLKLASNHLRFDLRI